MFVGIIFVVHNSPQKQIYPQRPFSSRPAISQRAVSDLPICMPLTPVCQVWMYGLASRLGACRAAAGEFATVAGMRDPNTPLLGGFDEERWDPTARKASHSSASSMRYCIGVEPRIGPDQFANTVLRLYKLPRTL